MSEDIKKDIDKTSILDSTSTDDKTSIVDTQASAIDKTTILDQAPAEDKTTILDSDPTLTQRATTTDIGAIKIQQLFKLMVDQGASDLHLSVGAAPALRIDGEIVRIKVTPLTDKVCRKIIYQVLSDKQKAELEKNLEIDFSFGVRNLARFRVNVFYSQGRLSAAFRSIPSVVPDFDALGLPSVLMDMTSAVNGLILVTGPTGSGKSTTLASIIDRLNQTHHGHIITLEDPIEFIHSHKNCIVNQREIGADSFSFGRGLKSLLRQDPDIILVGELRDQETIEAALTIAETGHLVFGTLHTNSTVQTINRIVNVFPSDKQAQIRNLLSFVLQGIVAQQLVPKNNGGRQLVQEILVPNLAIRNLIREDKIHQIYSQMQIGQDDSGMVTMNQSLIANYDKGLISQEDAISFSSAPDELLKHFGLAKVKRSA